MSRLVQFVWIWLSFNVIVVAAATVISDCVQRGRAQVHRGRSWSVPEQRQGERLSGRF